MRIFKQSNQKLSEFFSQDFKLEKDIQNLFENHLEQLLGLQFLASEFSIEGQRFDTLAFDKEAKSFVVIEYKRSKHYSVFDRGVSYLHTLLTHRADFLLEYQERTGKLLRRNEIDWSQSKVIFVAPAFTDFQKQAVDFRDLNIDLIEVKRYAEEIIGIDYISKSNQAMKIELSSKDNSKLAVVTKELKTYTESEHLEKKSEELIELYKDVKEAIYQLIADIDVIPQKRYISFKRGNRHFVDIEIQQKQLKLFLNAKWGDIDDARKLARNVKNIGHLGNGDYEIKVKDTKDLEYIMSLIKQFI